MHLQTACSLPRHLDTRPPSRPVGPITRLRVHNVLLCAAVVLEARRSAGTLADRRIKLPAYSVIQRQAARHLPRVLHVGADVVATVGRRPNMVAAGKVGRRDGDGIRERATRSEEHTSELQSL